MGVLWLTIASNLPYLIDSIKKGLWQPAQTAPNFTLPCLLALAVRLHSSFHQRGVYFPTLESEQVLGPDVANRTRWKDPHSRCQQ